MNKVDTYYDIAREKYREAWDRNKQVQRKASGALGVAGVIIAFAVNASNEVTLWWLIPGMFFAKSLACGIWVLLPATWSLDPNAISFGSELDDMEDEEARREAANSYAVAARDNGETVNRKAHVLIFEYVFLALAVGTLVAVIGIGG